MSTLHRDGESQRKVINVYVLRWHEYYRRIKKAFHFQIDALKAVED